VIFICGWTHTLNPYAPSFDRLHISSGTMARGGCGQGSVAIKYVHGKRRSWGPTRLGPSSHAQMTTKEAIKIFFTNNSLVVHVELEVD